VNNRTRQEHEEKNGHGTPGPRACDPMIEEYSQPTQAAVDRARTQAACTVRRATADLRRLQTERLFRAATFPADADASRFGLASFEEILPNLQSEANARLLAALEGHAATSRVPEITKQTESVNELRRHGTTEAVEILQSAA